MSFWIRDANLTIGKKKYDLREFNFSFEISFEDSDEPPVATITVTNLSESTRSNIKKNDRIILNAGYEGDVGCILIGKVAGLKHKQSNTDWLSTLTVLPCADEILGKQINKTYARNTKASAIVKDLLNIFGVEVAKCELSEDKTYPRGRVCKGNLKKVLAEIVTTECKSRFVIRPTGQLFITKDDVGIGKGVLLTSASGLLRANEEKVQIEPEPKKKATKSEPEKLISRTCLLNHRISTAEFVKIQSDSLNGIFVVAKGKHKGGNSGEWKTYLELKPAKIISNKPAAKGPVEGGSYKVGDIVNFSGSKHYVSSIGDRGSNCKPGKAKVTQVAKGAKHPYHLIYQNGGGSTVYGWVNASDIKGKV